MSGSGLLAKWLTHSHLRHLEIYACRNNVAFVRAYRKESSHVLQDDSILKTSVVFGREIRRPVILCLPRTTPSLCGQISSRGFSSTIQYPSVVKCTILSADITHNSTGQISTRTFCSELNPSAVKAMNSNDATMCKETSAVDIDNILSSIIDKANIRNIPALKTADKLKPVVELFVDYGANVKAMTKFILAHPNIVVKNIEQLESAMKFLVDYGFPVNSAFGILPVAETIFQPNRKNVIAILDLLRGYKMTDEDVIKVACSIPQILNLKNPKILSSKINNLGELFMHEDLVNELIKWPGILLADPENVRLKFAYITETMNMKYMQLTRSKALRYPLQHIKARHLFLLRAGLFETPDKNKETKHVKNPSVKGMVDSSDKEFVVKFAGGLTVADYQAFCHVLNLEEQLAEEEEVDNIYEGALGYKKGNENF